MEKITDKYKDLHHYHSGGGCVHLMLESSVDEDNLQWLINPLEKNCDDEPSYNLNRITEDARCMFGYAFLIMTLMMLKKKYLILLSGLLETLYIFI